MNFESVYPYRQPIALYTALIVIVLFGVSMSSLMCPQYAAPFNVIGAFILTIVFAVLFVQERK